MKKTTTILLLGLALVSFKANAQDDSMFSNFANTSVEHPLMAKDDGYLSDIEDMQKNITKMQLELREKELEYKVQEQNKKLDLLLNPPVEEKEEVVEKKQEKSILDRFIPVSNIAPVAPVVVDSYEEETSLNMHVSSIKGLQGNLMATVVNEGVGTEMVREGDVLSNGFKVVKISKKTVTMENAKGDIETIALSARK
ncbi:MAG: hypothetical protein N4A43_03725 [Alphaproteobacteria bacterium]|jgi:uncharacterized coiled-coil protein SlyX|nr:hypothetical protein [Alphaproteobacteria bacterium]